MDQDVWSIYLGINVGLTLNKFDTALLNLIDGGLPSTISAGIAIQVLGRT